MPWFDGGRGCAPSCWVDSRMCKRCDFYSLDVMKREIAFIAAEALKCVGGDAARSVAIDQGAAGAGRRPVYGAKAKYCRLYQSKTIKYI